MNTDPKIQHIVTFFETLQAADVARMDTYYAPQARFRDPFNDVQGLAHIQHVFAHMFVALDHPRFKIIEAIGAENSYCLTWDFEFRVKGWTRDFKIHGLSHLRFNENNLITEHLDYWDAANELYAQLPLIGGLMRWLARRLKTPA